MLKLVILAAALAVLPSVGCGASHDQKTKTRNQVSVSTPPSSIPSFEKQAAADKDENSSQKEPGSTRPPWTDPFWSNWSLVLVGGLGIVAALLTLRTIKKQGNIANRTLVAQFRPKVIARRIELLKHESGSWTIQLQIDNVGGTNATIKDGFVEIGWRQAGELNRYQPLHRASLETFSLRAGEEWPVSIPIADNGTFAGKMAALNIQTRVKARHYGHSVEVNGTISYADDDTRERKTRFSRTLNPKTMRFAPSTDPEYEYQD